MSSVAAGGIDMSCLCFHLVWFSTTLRSILSSRREEYRPPSCRLCNNWRERRCPHPHFLVASTRVVQVKPGREYASVSPSQFHHSTCSGEHVRTSINRKNTVATRVGGGGQTWMAEEWDSDVKSPIHRQVFWNRTRVEVIKPKKNRH